jgi:hypothetical protein
MFLKLYKLNDFSLFGIYKFIAAAVLVLKKISVSAVSVLAF